jgi:hypothetical protein
VVIGDASISRRVIRHLIREVENQTGQSDTLSKNIIYCSCEIPKLVTRADKKFSWNKGEIQFTDDQKVNISLARLQQDTLSEALRLWDENPINNKLLDVQFQDLQVT